MLRALMDSLPIWSILAITLCVVLLAIEVGYQLGTWRARSGGAESEANISSTTGASLALLAFMMAFSFSMAANHHIARKQLLTDEANALGTAHLRARLLHTEQGRRIRALLEQYAELRTHDPGDNLAEATQYIADSLDKQTAIWEVIEEMSLKDEPTVFHILLIQSVNEVFDLHEERVTAGLRNRVPTVLWGTLMALTCMSMIAIGYFSGTKGRRMPIANTGLALSFSIVMFLIADLDRPGRGLVQTDFSVMLELNQRLTDNKGE